VLSAAVPPLSVPVPSEVDPSKNSREPVGGPPAVVTFAVSVTDWPDTGGFGDTVNVVLVRVSTVSR
jgi:hypothetical protein